MENRKFGNTGLTPSILGFGMMRLQKREDGSIDEQWAIDTLRWAIDHGLSYVDTAYAYGDSERVTGLCLQDGYREKVTLASVSGIGAINDLVSGVWDVEKKAYFSNHFTGVYEVTNLTGTITTMNGEYYPHLHISAGDAQGHVVGGHLNSAVVSATSEIVLHLIDGTVERKFDPQVGLNLLSF